jgi:lipopolysaccharide/colanic/teichoic acid biosynthesis glycosyltransferase
MPFDAVVKLPSSQHLRIVPKMSADSPWPEADCRRSMSTTDATPSTDQFSLAKQRLQNNEPLLDAEGNKCPTYRTIKRALDIVGSLTLLILLSPLLVAVFFILCVTTRGKPMIRQERIGYRGVRFWMYKFRSMRLDAEKLQHLVQNEHRQGPIFKNRNDPRITRIGRIIRRTSIDELPQLVSVLLGDMSLVGPRPPLAKEVAQYKSWQRRRLAIQPGLTCLWQVSGRSEIGFDEWVRMDIWYAKNQNLRTDLALLLRTPLSVVSGRGAY